MFLEMSDLALQPGNLHDERVALVALLLGGAVPKAHLAAMVEHAGSAIAILAHSYRSSAAQAALFESNPDPLIERALREVDSWDDLPYAAWTVLDEEYPSLLRTVHNRPPLLFVEGNADLMELTGVSIVGTRQATDAGLRRATKLAKELGRRGLVIVSGLAAGIDTAAHTAALDVGARTIAVVGTGLQRTYPKANTFLARRIVNEGGALVSQFLPASPPTQSSFPQRNVTMSGLSVATVVVEASATSGARMQARSALQHGRTVFLLRSLVDQHEWAQAMVDQGIDGAKAYVLSDADDLVSRMDPAYTPQAFQIA